ncbi:hypothetical protein PAPYR_5731 [Paratrimastix pyriformis]|uniref:Flavodoxin-like domain-containing protein n=1 Tax=Paratrimastix pyriformis TaxID=342808 RepID=A0ABQ8UH26_9EUKA|nr:hypothetical protein PAPYR_5731 [Paratrimastix pyriformis]
MRIHLLVIAALALGSLAAKPDVLILYTTRTNHTRTVVEQVAGALGESAAVTVHGVHSSVTRPGILGYAKGIFQAFAKEPLVPLQEEPISWDRYDTVIIAGPIHCWNYSPVLRSYLLHHEAKFGGFPRKIKMGMIATQGGSGAGKAFKSASDLLALQPAETLVINESQLKRPAEVQFLSRQFASNLIAASTPAPLEVTHTPLTTLMHENL